jgi:hypothetical protein
VNSASTNSPAAFADVLSSMAAVERLKSREEVLAIEADLPARVVDVTARLKEVYARQGVTVSDQTIAQGVEQFFSQRLVFREPTPTLGTRLAPLWTHRVRILLVGGVLSFVALLAGTAIYLGVVVPAREAQARELAAARQQIELAEGKLHATEKAGGSVFPRTQQEIAKVAQTAPEPEIPKAAAVAETQLTAERATFDEKLKRAANALTAFTPAATLKPERIPGALATARQTLDAVAAAEQDLDQAAGLASHLGKLRAERVSLETAWKRLDHPGLPAGLKTSAEQTYANGLALVTAFGPVGDVHRATTRLHALADTEAELRSLPADIKTAAAEARALSRDPRADEQITTTERAGIAAADAGDATAAEKALASLREITARLGEVYTLRIVNRPREYTRFWRYPNGKTSVKNYYVAVEAIAPDGRLVSVPIRSEENGSVASVTKWAERVDQATYDAIGRDKQDDGIIQKGVFGQKEKGHLVPTYEFGSKARGGDVEAGRINRWEYRG